MFAGKIPLFYFLHVNPLKFTFVDVPKKKCDSGNPGLHWVKLSSQLITKRFPEKYVLHFKR